MKNIKLQFSFLILISLLILSCDESFNPKTEFEEGYSLFCVIDGNSSYQTAYITKNYNPEDLNPENYNEDKSVSGAEITLTSSDTVYKFKDTVLISSKTGKPYNSYYLENYSDKFGSLSLSVKLAGEEKNLNAEIISAKRELSLVYSSSRDLIFDLEEDYVVAFYERPKPFYFVPSLFINYSTVQNGIETAQRIEVPFKIVNDEIPAYPDLTLRNIFKYTIALIEKTMRQIATIVPSSSSIIIKGLTLEILELTEELGAYYDLNKSFKDGYTIKEQRAAYTNIKGGNGMFGYKYVYKFNRKFHPNWEGPILSMGYRLER